jgi:hypothetical protein
LSKLLKSVLQRVILTENCSEVVSQAHLNRALCHVNFVRAYPWQARCLPHKNPTICSYAD